MDESIFDVDRSTVLEGTRRFPRQHPTPRTSDTPGDLEYLSSLPGRGFREHCFDENGHS